MLASSTAAYGYIYGAADAVPDYLPVDEDHPCRPTDPYGLSKVVGERIAPPPRQTALVVPFHEDRLGVR